jgi:outer membrane protease
MLEFSNLTNSMELASADSFIYSVREMGSKYSEVPDSSKLVSYRQSLSDSSASLSSGNLRMTKLEFGIKQER